MKPRLRRCYMLPNVSLNLDANQSCNWRCCLICCHPKDDDVIYITRKYKIKKLDSSYVSHEEKIRETHERIEYYIRYKCESKNDFDLSIKRVRSELQIDILNKRDFITYSDLKRINSIVKEVVEQ